MNITLRASRLRCAAVLSVAILLTACGGAGAQPSASTAATAAAPAEPNGEITLFSYAGVFHDNYVKAVVNPFMKKFPKIKVNIQDGQNSAQMLAQLRAQAASPQIDVAIMDVSIAKTGNDEGLFQPLDPTVVTNMADLYEQAQTPNNLGPSVTFDNLVMIYNTDQVKPAPTSWGDLWNASLKGKVVITAPPDIQGLAMTIITDKLAGADYKTTIDPAIAKLKELAPLVQTWSPQPDQYTLVSNGTAAIAISWNARSQIYSDQSGGKLGVVFPKEGSIFQKNTINLVKGTKNGAAAQVFINYALSPEAQTAFTETMFYAPVNKKVQLGAKVLGRTASSPALVAQMIPVDWPYISQIRDQWLDRWRKEVISR